MEKLNAVPLAPSVIKTLATSLRKQQKAAALSSISSSQAIEIVSRALGYPNWHAAQKAPLVCPQEIWQHAPARQRLYQELTQLLAANVDIVSALGYLRDACLFTQEHSRRAAIEQLLNQLERGHTLGQALTRCSEILRVEGSIIQKGEQHRGLSCALTQAAEVASWA